MWRLMRAEYRYYRYSIATAVIVFILFVGGYFTCVTTGSSFIRYHHILLATAIPAMVAAIAMLVGKSSEKRDRFFAQLPIEPWRIGAARILFALTIWYGTAFLFWFIPAATGSAVIDRSIVLVMWYLNGSFLFINALYFVSVDIRYVIPRRRLLFGLHTDELLTALSAPVIIILWFFTFGLPFEFVFGVLEPLRLTVKPVVVSLPGVVVLNLAGAALSFGSVALFVRRRTFTM